MVDNIFLCHHVGATPPNMGRGKAREQRLKAYFGRKCEACAVESARIFHASLTSSVKTLTQRLAEVSNRY